MGEGGRVIMRKVDMDVRMINGERERKSESERERDSRGEMKMYMINTHQICY